MSTASKELVNWPARFLIRNLITAARGLRSSPVTEQPAIRRLRQAGLPGRWRLRDACGLSRLNDVLTP